jgi:thioredoxin reductase
MLRKRIAILGAGPIGLEAALYGASLGHDVHVYERGRVAHNMKSWGHVILFSSWRMNHSALGARTLAQAGVALPDPDDYLTGFQHVERYLQPLTRSAPLEGRVHEGVEVLYVGRDGIGKRDLIGGPRHQHPFRLLINGSAGEKMVEADIVIDSSGTYGNPNWMGNGNIPALGEEALCDRIPYTLEDIAGADRARYEEKRVLLVGSGHSAATALEALVGLPDTSILWVSRTTGEAPLPVIPDDPLPERARLCRLANRLASGQSPRVDYRPATEVERLELRDEGFEVDLSSNGTTDTVQADRILAHVGYRPDNRIYGELQVHECYASLGPMKLATALLGESSADCLTQTSKGADILTNPEPNFYILGSKSYGKHSNFLIRIGLEQVQEVFTLIEGRPELDLYAA